MTTTLDAAERQGRELASAVKRLRVLATSDPERSDDLADALVRLTATRLLGLAYAEAATLAQESVLLAARLLAQRGPAGPYASARDAVRYFTASAQLAAIQAGLGMPEAAGRTLAAVEAWRQQVWRLPLAEHLAPATAVWALLARARSVLDTDPAAANASADAAAARLYAEGLDAAPATSYLALEVHLLLADCRWSAGLVESALAHHRLALARHRSAVDGVDRATGVRPAVIQLALAPVVRLFEPYAGRLESAGDPAGGLAIRRAEILMLARFADATGTARQAVTRMSLAEALDRSGRAVEAAAEKAAAEAMARRAELVLPQPITTATPGQRVTWTPLRPVEALATGEVRAAASARLQQEEQRAVFDGAAARAEAERSEAAIRDEFERASAEQAAAQLAEARLAAAEASAAQAAAVARERTDAELAAARRQAEEAVARQEAARRREELAASHRPKLEVDAESARAAVAELQVARGALGHASSAGDLAGTSLATEAMARLLQPLAEADPQSHGDELLGALESLVSLRWRLGDGEGSREAAKQAKALTAKLGR